MINSHSNIAIGTDRGTWQPIWPPKRGQDRTAFHAFMLLPGMSLSFYAAVLRRSRSSVAAYRTAAIEAARHNSAIAAAVDAAACAIRPEDGLKMAHARGGAQLTAWSRLAMGDYRRRGFSRREIAVAFRCSPSTVANVLQGKGTTYALFSGERRLSPSQRRPPGQWMPARIDPDSQKL